MAIETSTGITLIRILFLHGFSGARPGEVDLPIAFTRPIARHHHLPLHGRVQV
jgi:hypothetical protein